MFLFLAFFPFAELESSLESLAGRGLFLLDALGWRGSSIVAGNIFGEVMLTIFVLPGKLQRFCAQQSWEGLFGGLNTKSVRWSL